MTLSYPDILPSARENCGEERRQKINIIHASNSLPQSKYLGKCLPSGKPYSGMKTFVFSLLVLACVIIPLRADILVNGNFADGKAHWRGDAQPLDQSDLSNPTTSAGVTITLKKDKWTKIYQVFTTKEKKLQYSITFKLSSDYGLDQSYDNSSTGGFVPRSPGLDDIEGIYPLSLYWWKNSWILVPYELGSYSEIYLKPDVQKPDTQTLTGTIHGFVGDTEKILLIAFPPGEGTITLQNISLTSSE